MKVAKNGDNSRAGRLPRIHTREPCWASLIILLSLMVLVMETGTKICLKLKISHQPFHVSCTSERNRQVRLFPRYSQIFSTFNKWKIASCQYHWIVNS